MRLEVHELAGPLPPRKRAQPSCAGIYRREQWRLPLAFTLLDLRDCAARLGLAQVGNYDSCVTWEQSWGGCEGQQLLDSKGIVSGWQRARCGSLVQEGVLHSLEVACLAGSLPDDQRRQIAGAALATLNEGTLQQGKLCMLYRLSPTLWTFLAAIGSNDWWAVTCCPLCGCGLHIVVLCSGLGEAGSCQLQVKPVNHPLLSCFLLSAGFKTLRSGDDTSASFGVLLRSFLPVDLPIHRLEVSGNDKLQ